MHERALMDDVIRKLETVALAEGGRVTRVRVRLGALSHFSTIPIVLIALVLNRYFVLGLTRGVH